MNLIDRAVAVFSPAAGLRRAQARAALQAVAHYRGADVTRNSWAVRAAAGDADAVATRDRRALSLAARDVVRNSAIAERAVQVIVNNIVGTGIEPKLISDSTDLINLWPSVRRLLDSVSIDADRVSTLAAVQRLMVRAMVVDGEAFLLLTRRPAEIDFSLRVLEMDYLDNRVNGRAKNSSNVVYEGIEYGPDGTVVAYHLYDEHPGSAVWNPDWKGATSSRVDAQDVIHLYRVDRPGQRRGVSWFAPVLDDLVALADNDEAQLMRQKIAACFAAFWKTEKDDAAAGIPSRLAPGLIQQIGVEDEVVFATPPDVSGYDDFARVHLRRIASGLGITYEALTGDLSSVNFSSARLGRIEMGQNVEAWQWGLVMPRLCMPIGSHLLRSVLSSDVALIGAWRVSRIEWTPPPPVIADPKTETQVAVSRIEAGLSSRPAEIRKLGYEPSEIDAEISRDEGMRKSLAALKAPAVAAAAQAEEAGKEPENE